MLDVLLDVNQYKQIGEAKAAAQSAQDRVSSVNERIDALEKRIESLIMFSQAIAEILEEKAGLKQAELLQKIEEIDMRDGVKDGKIGTGGGRKCEKCNRGYNSKLNKCLYCGYVRDLPNVIIK